MLGRVSGYNEKSGKGLIEDPYGNVYLFDVNSIVDDSIPFRGMSVYFELTDTTKVNNIVEAVKQVLPVFNWRALAILLVMLGSSI